MQVMGPIFVVLFCKTYKHKVNKINRNKKCLKWNLYNLEQKMDSIFQIKINENKLHKILTQFNKDQHKLQEQINDIFSQIKTTDSTMAQWKKDLQQKIQGLLSKISNIHSLLSEEHKQSLRQVKSSIAQTAEAVFIKHSEIQQNIIANQKQMHQKGNQLAEKISQLTNIVQQNKKKYQNGHQIIEKIGSLQKTLNKTAELTKILENKNFLYFLQMLVDRQTDTNSFKISDALKQTKNPLLYEPNEQKTKRYKDVKRILNETQNKIQKMQTQYTGYFNTVVQKNKQNRQQTHMHYALLSTKIKEIEHKLSEQQILGIQTQCMQKILYPSQFNIKQKVKKKKKRNSEMNFNQSSFFIPKSQENDIDVEQQIQKLKSKTSKQNKQVFAKLEKIQDEVWSNNNKVGKIKQLMKVQLDKIYQKIKSISYKNQYIQRESNSNPSLNTKNLADFVHQFRNIQEDIEQKLKQKVDSTLYKRQQQQNYQKNKILSQQIQMKANKEEIRKAITFIQEKIKQIVTLIASMQNLTHKTAGRKMIVQCLSCDDNFFQDKPTTHLMEQNTNSISNLSHNISPGTTRIGCNFTLRKDRQKVRHQYRKSNFQQ